MKRPVLRLYAVLIAGSFLFAAASSAIAAGTSADPLVTRKHMQSVLMPYFVEYLNYKTGSAGSGAGVYDSEIKEKGETALELLNLAGLAAFAADDLILPYAGGISPGSVGFSRKVTVRAGQALVVSPGATVLLTEGLAIGYTDGRSTVVSLTAGREMAGSWMHAPNKLLLVSEKGPVSFEPNDQSATFLVTGNAAVVDAARLAPEFTDLAEALFELGLFAGTDKGFELERAPLRSESLVMTIRLLGKEQAARAVVSPSTPFSDVAAWFLPYGSYAYGNQLTYGIGGGLFGSDLLVSADEYMTFLLRALGYSDTGANPDFTYTAAIDAAVRLKVLTQKEADMLKRGRFSRDKMVFISYYSLFAYMKDGRTTLLQRLIDDKVIERDVAWSVINSVARGRE